MGLIQQHSMLGKVSSYTQTCLYLSLKYQKAQKMSHKILETKFLRDCFGNQHADPEWHVLTRRRIRSLVISPHVAGDKHPFQLFWSYLDSQKTIITVYR